VTLLFIAIGVLIVGGALFVFGRPAKSARPEPVALRAPGAFEPTVRRAPAAVPAPPPPPVVVLDVPPELARLRILRPDALDDERKQAIVLALQRVPRPPPRLHQLISREFVTHATSAELSALVMTEPLMAAKVLATVNSPFYGLKKPVVSIGQAVTFLGFNAVRSMGMQYLLNDSFKAASPELKSIFETLWASSSLASELCCKLAQKLDLPEQGALVTHMVLYFIGQLATYSMMPAQLVVATARLGFMARLQEEQALLGLGSADIGGLLLQEWALPPSIVEDVRDIDHILVTPLAAMDAYRGPRLALCYLCARLGEKLARGSLSDLAAFDLLSDLDLEFFHLRSYLAAPALSKLPALLRAEDLLASVAMMQEAARLPGT
jgi:HD-like signal output (HDOD) protein